MNHVLNSLTPITTAADPLRLRGAVRRRGHGVLGPARHSPRQLRPVRGIFAHRHRRGQQRRHRVSRHRHTRALIMNRTDRRAQWARQPAPLSSPSLSPTPRFLSASTRVQYRAAPGHPLLAAAIERIRMEHEQHREEEERGRREAQLASILGFLAQGEAAVVKGVVGKGE